MTLSQVAFDIETTGFAVDDEVTAVGFGLPLGLRLFYQSDGRYIDAADAEAVEERLSVPATVTAHSSEQGMLAAVRAFADERLKDDEVVLVAYNGETWSGGFDLPFLRTRCARTFIDWPFVDVPYSDLLPMVRKLFNTTTADGDVNDLDGAYELLCRGEDGDLDPFEDSAEAVTAFEEGRFDELLLHNAADVRRTQELGWLAEEYCSKSDFQLKSLSPTIAE